MLRRALLPAVMLVSLAHLAPVSAGCSQHTFDRCPEPAPAYDLEVDSRTGRTWLKNAPPPPVDEKSRLARLSAAAKNVPPGAMAKKQSEGQWQTRVEAETRPPPRLK